MKQNACVSVCSCLTKDACHLCLKRKMKKNTWGLVLLRLWLTEGNGREQGKSGGGDRNYFGPSKTRQALGNA